MRKNLFVLLLLLPGISDAGGDPKYAVKDIPEELRTNVDAVIRTDEVKFTIHAKDRATQYVHFAATIFNSKAKHYAEYIEGYDKLSKITTFKGSVYNAQGELVKKLKSSDIYDQSSFDGFSLFSDNRIKVADLTQGSYPYTVEFELEIDFKFLYHIPGTYLLSSPKVSSQQVTYELVFPNDLEPRYKLVNLEQEPKRTDLGNGKTSLFWSFENLKPIEIEPYGPDREQQLPHILAAPSKFAYDGYEGDMTTWEDYGKWKYKLLIGRGQLPEESKAKVRELTKNLNTVEEKAKVLYEYLQGKTRYVSIQLGIGGLQPFEASLVDKVGYGDCKALSNYMIALLKEAGINGLYCTIKAGSFEDDLMLDFPSHQSNHVVVAVPNGTDTLWLECTDQRNAFGYAGRFTGDRKAFAVSVDGGKWINTPSYAIDDNVQSTHADVFVSGSGDATAEIKTTYTGLQSESNGLNFAMYDPYDDQKKWIQKNTQVPIFDIESFKMSTEKDKIPRSLVEKKLVMRRFATVSGKRMFLSLNLDNRSSFVPEKVDNRKTIVVRKYTYMDVDTIRYHVPESIYPEFLPEPVHIESRFGVYDAHVITEQGDVLYIRRLRIYRGEFPAETYGELIDFYKSIGKADNMKLVFANKT